MLKGDECWWSHTAALHSCFYLPDGYLTCLNQQNQNNAGTYSINHGLPLHMGTWLFQVNCSLPASCETAESQSKWVTGKESRARNRHFSLGDVGSTNLGLTAILNLHSSGKQKDPGFKSSWSSVSAGCVSSTLLAIVPVKYNKLKAYYIRAFLPLVIKNHFMQL